jgi:hypothetical protein
MIFWSTVNLLKKTVNCIDGVFILKPIFYCTIIPEQIEAQYFIRLDKYIIEHIKEYQRPFYSFSKQDQY